MMALMGLSWGSMVGLMVAEKRPDLLYAYVGVGQGIGMIVERVGARNTSRSATAAVWLIGSTALKIRPCCCCPRP